MFNFQQLIKPVDVSGDKFTLSIPVVKGDIIESITISISAKQSVSVMPDDTDLRVRVVADNGTVISLGAGIDLPASTQLDLVPSIFLPFNASVALGVAAAQVILPIAHHVLPIHLVCDETTRDIMVLIDTGGGDSLVVFGYVALNIRRPSEDRPPVIPF